jgi:hypothetical protein
VSDGHAEPHDLGGQPHLGAHELEHSGVLY